jgi:hypothetical protein
MHAEPKCGCFIRSISFKFKAFTTTAEPFSRHQLGRRFRADSAIVSGFSRHDIEVVAMAMYIFFRWASRKSRELPMPDESYAHFNPPYSAKWAGMTGARRILL